MTMEGTPQHIKYNIPGGTTASFLFIYVCIIMFMVLVRYMLFFFVLFSVVPLPVVLLHDHAARGHRLHHHHHLDVRDVLKRATGVCENKTQLIVCSIV